MPQMFHIMPGIGHDIKEHTRELECWCHPRILLPCESCRGTDENCQKCYGTGWWVPNAHPSNYQLLFVIHHNVSQLGIGETFLGNVDGQLQRALELCKIFKKVK